MNSTAPLDDLDFDLPELDDDDDPFAQDTYDRRNKRIHAWLREQCCLVLPSLPKSLDSSDASRTLKHRHSSTAGSSAQTTTDDGSELEDARADSPLLGFTGPSHSRSPSTQRLAELAASPLPPCSPPMRRQSRLHANSISLSSGSPHALSHTSSTLSLAGMQSMRNAVYIDSDEIRKRLDDLMHTQAEADHGIDEAQEVDYFIAKHRPQKSSSSISVFAPPPSSSLQSFSVVGPSRLAPPPNTPSTHGYQTPFASSSQVYLGPVPPLSRGRSESQSQVNFPHLSKDVKPPSRPPPAPPLVIEPALTHIRDASMTVPTSNHPYGAGNDDGETLNPPPGTVSKWSLASSTVDDGEKKEKKKRKSFIAGVIGPSEKDKKRGRLVSFISRLSEVGSSSGPASPTFVLPDEYVPPVPTLLPSAVITAERKDSLSAHPPSSDAIPAPGALKILTNLASLQPHPSAAPKPAGTVSGTWEPLSVPVSSQPVPASPSGLLPQDPFAPPLPPSHPHPTVTGLGRASSEGMIGNTLPNRARANSSAAEQWLSKESKPLPPPPTPSGLGLGNIIRPRPTLTKSFSSSVLNGRYVYPQQQHYNSPSITRLRDEEEEEEEEDEEDYGTEVGRQTTFVTRPRGLSSPMVMRGTPTTPLSATSSTFSQGTTGTMTPPTSIADGDTKGAALLHQMEAHRQRLRSMSSVGNFGPRPLPHEAQGEGRERKRGLRSLVHWMGLTSPSPTSPTETSASRISESTVVPSTPSFDYPFPPPTPMGSQFQGSSGTNTPQKTPSPGHSPTSSLSGIKDGLGGGILQSIMTKPKHKRRLVIAGVEYGDEDAVEAVRTWCEGFGEVKDFTWAGDGTINVDFRKASVADTVCRIQAGVYIKGAGSVSVSWSTKRRM